MLEDLCSLSDLLVVTSLDVGLGSIFGLFAWRLHHFNMEYGILYLVYMEYILIVTIQIASTLYRYSIFDLLLACLHTGFMISN